MVSFIAPSGASGPNEVPNKVSHHRILRLFSEQYRTALTCHVKVKMGGRVQQFAVPKWHDTPVKATTSVSGTTADGKRPCDSLRI